MQDVLYNLIMPGVLIAVELIIVLGVLLIIALVKLNRARRDLEELRQRIEKDFELSQQEAKEEAAKQRRLLSEGLAALNDTIARGQLR
ncbi:MAG: hypothetical protein IKY06_04425 [Clostridia bacterium]|nr:hypothetical protein [Clostridia bacterium]MBR5009867.1 hypothetical protein [Clostridia bacterium]MBR5257581.1 hypothetical protein [Clostridia bacterium]MBR5986732.1 hypothetical protein [Clostridia bacterium]MBR6008672.1 hypothetical protein [Clostridia bacterium]